MLCLSCCHSVQDMSAGEIGSLLRHPAAGDQIAACVQSFPYLQMEAQLHPITRTVLRIQLTITPAFTWKDRWVVAVDAEGVVIGSASWRLGHFGTHDACHNSLRNEHF
jgi:hypothetical protein